ncbi:MAG: HD domain-containing protein [Cyanobacteria bacterium SIG31]|nr:HD domain-containing protein [Cyanobacteria bacterium SIG31]
MKFFYNAPIKLNIPSLPFRSLNPAIIRPQGQPINDGFASNPLYDKFGTKAEIEAVAKNNPRIRDIMSKYNLPLKVNMEELEKLKQGHMKETRIATAKMYSSLPTELKKEVSLPELQEAAMLHDYGKVLIPDEILNKKGRLNEKEREIMELHSELGYELLKDKGLSQKTLNLIKYHHQNLNKNGYPAVNKDFEFGIDAQILNTADKYSALREKRSYKNPLGKYEAFEIIAKDVNNGQISQEVYTALIRSV